MFARQWYLKYWQLFMVMVDALCKMWTIKSFQNKKGTHEVTAPLIPLVGDAKAVTSNEFPAYRGTNMECIWGESSPNPPPRREWGGAGVSNDRCIKLKWLKNKNFYDVMSALQSSFLLAGHQLVQLRHCPHTLCSLNCQHLNKEDYFHRLPSVIRH